MIRRDTPVLRWLSMAAAFLFMVLPFPDWLSALRPFLLALVVAYWFLETPQRMGLGRVFLIGLVLDLASFSVLGEHALRLVLIAGVLHLMRSRFRFYPVWQQSGFLMLMLYVDLAVLWLMHLSQGLPMVQAEVWGSPVLAFLIWPWLYMLLDNLRLQNRGR
jgi:rod shape-determining protein MreD